MHFRALESASSSPCLVVIVAVVPVVGAGAAILDIVTAAVCQLHVVADRPLQEQQWRYESHQHQQHRHQRQQGEHRHDKCMAAETCYTL